MYDMLKKYKTKILWVVGTINYGFWFYHILSQYLYSPKYDLLGIILASFLIAFLYGTISFSVVLFIGIIIKGIHDGSFKS
jgi:hypothetical protein